MNTPHPFLGRTDEIALISRDLAATARGLLTLGVGPWRVYEINPSNTEEMRYNGRPAEFVIRVAFAEVNAQVWEIMHPISGPTIFDDHLRRTGAQAALHHVSFGMNQLPWAERLSLFEKRGFRCVQHGHWLGGVRFAFFDTQSMTGMTFETYEFAPGFEYPDPIEHLS